MNRLEFENSLYLKQHKNNPVNWLPWNNESLELAVKEQKLLIISIGYSSCHWCHVMEKESFTDDEVAEVMNKYFINIKVDREERPDIDSYYMSAVQKITRQGGWPLNCFALPDGRPFYGGTYFPKDQWLSLMENIVSLYANDSSKIIDYANELDKDLISSNLFSKLNNSFPDNNLLASYVSEIMKYTDKVNGGFSRAPKFPMPVIHSFLSDYSNIFNKYEIAEYLNTTLEKIANGGIYDHLAGGFARYSVDDLWKVPHFEKMLYDNAQLIYLYSQAYSKTNSNQFLTCINNTIAFLQTEMTSANKGCFSAIDADSEGVEGLYYLWNYAEIKSVSDNNIDNFIDYYGITQNGNFEHGKNVIYIRNKHNSNLEDSFNGIKNELLRIRNLRQRPQTDTKIITSWNALLVSAYIKAGVDTNNYKIVEKGLDLASCLFKNMCDEEGNVIRIKYSNSVVKGMAEDYAYLALAFIDAYTVSLNMEWVEKAVLLTERLINKFKVSDLSLFQSSCIAEVNTVSIEVEDTVTPSYNAVVAEVLVKLGLLLNKNEWVDMSKEMVKTVVDKISNLPIYYGKWLQVILMHNKSLRIVYIEGLDAESIAMNLLKLNYPNLLVKAENSEKSISLKLCGVGYCTGEYLSLEEIKPFLQNS